MNYSNLSRFYYFLVVLWTILHKTSAGCASNEWAYKEEKCVRVLDLLSNHSVAERICQEHNSTLLSITSPEEQEFFRELLFSELEIFDNVWLGAVRINSTESFYFEWTDGSPWTFDDWKLGSPSRVEGNDCAQMVFQRGRTLIDRWSPYGDIEDYVPPISGLWSDDVCGRHNLVVCQRRPSFSLDQLTALFFRRLANFEALQEYKLDETTMKIGSLYMMKQEFEEAKSKILQVSQDLDDLEKNPVPLGFVYTQLPGQPDPSVIWPKVKWTQITKDYAGLFFRAEGGNSSAFGQLQYGNSPRLYRVESILTRYEVERRSNVSVPWGGFSDFIYTCDHPGLSSQPEDTRRFFMSFYSSGGEVRPKNKAIRLWKRTA